MRDLICTIDNNITREADRGCYSGKFHDNLPDDIIPEFRKLSAQKGQSLLEELDDWLSQHDRDNNPSVSGTGRHRAGIGIYYFEEELGERGEEK